jgi:hypothetical protein
LELFTNFIFFAAIFLILSFCLPQVEISNISVFNAPNIFLPFGIILFSLIGWSAIPEIADFLKLSQRKKSLKKIIISATVIIVLFYLIFTAIIIGVTGKNITPDALASLTPYLGGKLMIFGILAALVTLADSFLVLSSHLKNTFICDLGLSKGLAATLTCFLPMLLFLLGLRSFISVLGFVGMFTGVIEGILIVLIFRKIKQAGNRTPEYSLKIPAWVLYSLIVILILGTVSQFL